MNRWERIAWLKPPPTPFIEIISGASLSGELRGRARVHLLEQDLHPGEVECIALAVEMRPETEARRIAGLSDLPVTGIIGLLLQAKAEGRVVSMREEMDGLGAANRLPI